MSKRTIPLEAVPEMLRALDCDDSQAQTQTLGALCPCRSECFDKDVWAAICRALDWPDYSPEVHDRAFHAVETLVEVAETDPRWQEMLHWLLEQGLLALPLERPGAGRKPKRQAGKRAERIHSGEIPRLLEAIRCGEADEQQRALKLLCPCRNARYDKEIWLTIFRAYREGEGGQVRDQAGHAIGTLKERARTDPRSQELVRWLIEEGVAPLSFAEALPEWKPGGRGGLFGLYIPRYERSPRSKANRRR